MEPHRVYGYSGAFDCDRCGKHNGMFGRTESPFHIVIADVQWNFCGVGCAKDFQPPVHA